VSANGSADSMVEAIANGDVFDQRRPQPRASTVSTGVRSPTRPDAARCGDAREARARLARRSLAGEARQRSPGPSGC